MWIFSEKAVGFSEKVIGSSEKGDFSGKGCRFPEKG